MVHISEREVELPEATIQPLLKIAAESKDIISLGPGEPDFITPKPLLDYAVSLLKKKLGTHYAPTEGYLKLREAICKKLRKDNKIKANPENIVVSVGSQEALFSAFLCTLDTSEQVIIPNPGYLAYIPAIELVNGFPVYVKLEEENNWEINPDSIKEAIDKKKTKVILINTPANPTGSVIRKKILEEIADIAREYDIYVFSDEAYEKLIYDKKHVSIGSLNGMNKYVVTFHTFSKSYAMAGFRLGYACGPEKLIKAMVKAKHYISIAAPSLSQLVGIKALSLGDKYTNQMRNEYNRRRNLIVKRLNELGLRTRLPDGAFYTFSSIDNYSKNSFKFAHEVLKKAKVAVVPGTEFGRYGEGYIRCSYATKYELIEKAMERLERYLKK